MQGDLPRARLRRYGLAVVLLGLLAGCAVTPPQPVPQGRAAQAQQLLQQGNYAAAAQLYESLAAGAQAQARDEYLVSAAEAWWQASQGQKAWKLLGEVQPAFLTPGLNARAELLKAQMDFAARQPQVALKHLQFPLTALPDELKARTLLLRAQVEAALGNTLGAVEDLSARENYLAGNPAAIHDNHQRIWQLIFQSHASFNMQALPPGISQTARGWLVLGNLTRNIWQQPRNMLQQLQAWQVQFPNHPAELDIVPELIAKQQALVTYPARIALLLPLSGAYQSVADAVRDGLFAAYFQLAGNGSAPAVTLYDAGATAASAQAAYRQAVAAGADMVVGPLIKNSVSGIAALGALPVPVLALNTLDANQASPAGLFQFGLPPEDEATQVANRVSAENLTRGLALVPQGDWGTRVLNAFATRFTQLGGNLLGTQTYTPGANDYSVPITRLLNLNDSQYREEQLAAFLGTSLQFEPRRRQDIQFIFLAANASDARLIRPQLRFFHAINVPVYATSQVYQPDAPADDDLDGITFDDMPWTLETSGAAATTRATVTSLWPNNFSSNSRLYALGFDAWRLIPLLYQGHAFNISVQGMTGLLSMTPDGRIHRQLDWATFINGMPQLLTPLAAPTAPIVAAPGPSP
ncbi:MAG TPA: penicillin-binding protein activator [Gammaproteobacteria bacterium]|nr:penicillin-binding protein activator [Gammaproteobacteria bacterium]